MRTQKENVFKKYFDLTCQKLCNKKKRIRKDDIREIFSSSDLMYLKKYNQISSVEVDSNKYILVKTIVIFSFENLSKSLVVIRNSPGNKYVLYINRIAIFYYFFKLIILRVF